MSKREASGWLKIGTEWSVEEARSFGGQADEKVCCKCTSISWGIAELGSEYVSKRGCWQGLSIQSILPRCRVSILSFTTVVMLNRER
jgi:hypothetical protein